MMLYIAFYDMDTNCVNVWLTDRSIVTPPMLTWC